MGAFLAKQPVLLALPPYSTLAFFELSLFQNYLSIFDRIRQLVEQVYLHKYAQKK